MLYKYKLKNTIKCEYGIWKSVIVKYFDALRYDLKHIEYTNQYGNGFWVQNQCFAIDILVHGFKTLLKAEL